MGPLHIIALLGCAEWLLIFRIWVSGRYILLYAGVGGLRLFYLMNLVPHWEYNYILSWGFFVAGAWHLRALWRGSAAHYQALSETPATGVPWMILIARNIKLVPALEFTAIVMFIYFMAGSRIIFTPGFLSLPQALQAWIVEHPLPFLWGYALWMPFSYLLWHQAVTGAPLRPERKPAPASAVHYVRQPERALPTLPSAKELADDIT